MNDFSIRLTRRTSLGDRTHEETVDIDLGQLQHFATASESGAAPSPAVSALLDWARDQQGEFTLEQAFAGSGVSIPAAVAAGHLRENGFASYRRLIGDTQRRTFYRADLVAATAGNISAAAALEWSPTLCDGKRVSYADAEKACAALGEGWRLPTRQELESILDLSRHNPAADPERFPDMKPDWYWSSTPCAWSSARAWCVGFNFGFVDVSHRGGNLAFVRAVRAVPAGQ